MRKKVTVLGSGDLAAACSERLAGDDLAEIVTDLQEISGSDVVVLAGAAPDTHDAIRDRAPNAVVIVVGDSPSAVCEATLFPRARIVGVDEDAGSACEVAEAVLRGRERVLNCVVRLEGERGVDGDFASAPVRIGAGGIHEILEDR